MGFAASSKLVLSGRVLKQKGVIVSSKTDTKWRNLINTFRRFATGEVGGARVRVRFRNAETLAITDAEGYFNVEMDLNAPLEARQWQDVELELVDAPAGPAVAATATGQVFVPPPTARFGVISDIDDTVISTHVTSTLKMLTTVLLSNAHVRTPFAGIAAFYKALQHGVSGSEGNPIFYVSNGPWNFHGLLVEFFKLNGIPLGPLFLRDFGASMLFSSRVRHGQKLLHIERILRAYDSLPFVLIGDSGERDPEIYAEVMKRYPRRIHTIYIRSVDRRPERLAAIDALAHAISRTPTQFVLANDSAFAAAHAAGAGLIASSALSQIQRPE